MRPLRAIDTPTIDSLNFLLAGGFIKINVHRYFIIGIDSVYNKMKSNSWSLFDVVSQLNEQLRDLWLAELGIERIKTVMVLSRDSIENLVKLFMYGDLKSKWRSILYSHAGLSASAENLRTFSVFPDNDDSSAHVAESAIIPRRGK